jgi:hypothetical protein
MDYIRNLGYEKGRGEIGQYWSTMENIKDCTYRSIKEIPVDNRTRNVIKSHRPSNRDDWKMFHVANIRGIHITSAMKSVEHTNSIDSAMEERPMNSE